MERKGKKFVRGDASAAPINASFVSTVGAPAPPSPVINPSPLSSATQSPARQTQDSGALGGFGQALAQEVDNATSKWMKMISSTFLGEHSGSVGGSIFSRKALPALTAGSGDDTSGEKASKDVIELKIALVGGAAVGKSSIVRRWLQRSYPSSYVPTIGVDVSTITFKHKKQNLLLHIWDVSSVEVDASASSLHALLCDDLDGVFFVFNVHRVSSIAAIDKWRHSLAKYISAKEIPFFLLSHKADLLQKRVMTSDDIASYARAAGFKGWMWTVGKPSFGENEKNPAVMDALEKMVEFICKDRAVAEQIRAANLTKPRGILESTRGSAPLEVIQTDDALHRYSASLLRIPTMAITTTPRDENSVPLEEKSSEYANIDQTPRQSDINPDRPMDYGGNWILGNDKGVYLRVTKDSTLVAHDETTDDDIPQDVFAFPFSGTRQLGYEDGDAGESTDDDVQREEEELERRREHEKQLQDEMNDREAWRFFAGSIDRARAEAILANRGEGSFLLRRKDAQTLILSYMGDDHVHHVLIVFANQKYHIGSTKSATAFPTLWKCIRSVRRYAYRGLVFTRNVDFRVVNKEELTLESDDDADAVDIRSSSGTPGVWRTRTRSGSSSSIGDHSTGSNSRQASPATVRKSRRLPGLQANQGIVKFPKKTRVDELSVDFYNQLTERLTHLANAESDSKSAALSEVPVLLEMVAQEKNDWKRERVVDAETQWRKLVKNMEAWNRIVMNLELSAVKVA